MSETVVTLEWYQYLALVPIGLILVAMIIMIIGACCSPRWEREADERRRKFIIEHGKPFYELTKEEQQIRREEKLRKRKPKLGRHAQILQDAEDRRSNNEH